MSIDFLVSHNNQTMIKNMCDNSYKLYDTRLETKKDIENIIGASSIIGISMKKSEKDEQVNSQVIFLTKNGDISSTITFKDEAAKEYVDVMSELNNRRLVDTYNMLVRKIENGDFSVINLIVDEYNSEKTDSTLDFVGNAIVYHLTKGKYGTLDGRDEKNISEIIDKFISVYGITDMQKSVKNQGVVLGNEDKALVSNEEHVINMINRKVGNYGKRI